MTNKKEDDSSTRSNHMRMSCPHCEEEIRVGVSFEDVEKTRRGPKPKVNPEVDAFIITAVEDYHLSFNAVGKLLEERETLTPKGSKRWFPSSVSRVYYAALERRSTREKTETPN